jgi:hypothetical protein
MITQNTADIPMIFGCLDGQQAPTINYLLQCTLTITSLPGYLDAQFRPYSNTSTQRRHASAGHRFGGIGWQIMESYAKPIF